MPKVITSKIPPVLQSVTIPKHIAIIMDGNGRWARQEGKSRIYGHRMGAKIVDEITTECVRLGVKRLTLYAFSSENWKRPKDEVDELMRLLLQYLILKEKKITRNNVQFTVIGRTHELPDFVRGRLQKLIEKSSANTGMILCLAINYGGRTEIIDACQKFACDVLKGLHKLEDLDESLLMSYMYDPDMEPPDLLIRTAGEMRISNFLLWHVPYTELYVTKVLWPDFHKQQLYDAIIDFSKRERKFGALGDLDN